MIIKPIAKPKKKRNQTSKYWRNKCDKLMQETGREIYDRCLVCGGEYCCLHHYHRKGTSTILRYHWENLIPICVKCHFKHHNGDPNIHNQVNEIKGKEWIKELESIRRHGIGMNAGYVYYREMYNKLLLLKPYKIKI